jgi:NAD(P)-dependent dehydrogenase (short-subunit alcohol dehydrogenase family)
MDARMDGKVAVVTGASRGIGLSTAMELLRAGATGVTITSRRADNIAAALSELVSAGFPSERVLAVASRADSEEDAESTAAATIERFGSLDILVNNAGTNPSAGPLMDVDMGAVDKTWSVNQRGPLVWTRAAWRHWMAEHGGVMINVASVGGLRPAPAIGAYNISKAALVHMTHQLAYELAPGVRVNAVAPGVVRTRLSEMLWKDDEAAAAAVHPLNRLGEPIDVANAIMFLCAAEWVTGVVLPVDGGSVGASAGLA